ncbi:anti-sigma factor antagonist [Falsiroseomonas tokyonensis]|uniref:Anti-sigma factor antagonist n=1 Tax=Falsiroseomonas tokyonensis TaxID=430521 RepID=A0ABV7C3D8_9PROT|nr:anti-sigma factor antagonist [Falsiroseomonas tokyonensis]MBU8540971.1 anti-sigma factor antagonist [Falsiroseomonas tokyonensis]
MQITAQREGDSLTMALAGRLDTSTAPRLGQEMDLDGVRHLVLDLDACHYVSSAGLREFLRARKRLAAVEGTMLLTNVSRDIQDILDMTGFSKLIPSRPKVRSISLEGLEFLSAGVCGECYRMDPETIVKLYREGIGADIAEKEKQYAKAAFVLGIPTAISFDVVACGPRTGVVYEMLDATLFSAIIRNDLQNIDRHAQLLAQVAGTVHQTPADPAIFPDIKANFRHHIGQMDFFLSPEEIALLHRLLETIPDAGTCVHFDLHTSNIMIHDGEPVIIDMGDLSRGHYLFDIGLLCSIYGYPETGICEMATKIPNAEGLRLLERFLEHYFRDKPAEDYRFFQQNRSFLASLRLIYTSTFLPSLRAESARIIKDILLPRMTG